MRGEAGLSACSLASQLQEKSCTLTEHGVASEAQLKVSGYCSREQLTTYRAAVVNLKTVAAAPWPF